MPIRASTRRSRRRMASMKEAIIEFPAMQTAPLLIALVLGAYCLGSISFAVVVSFFMRLPDPRSYGSKNPGATNVLRSGSKLAALLTLAGDAGKGWLAVWLASVFTGDSATIA